MFRVEHYQTGYRNQQENGAEASDQNKQDYIEMTEGLEGALSIFLLLLLVFC